MSRWRNTPAMVPCNLGLVAMVAILLVHFSVLASAQGSKRPWKTLDGSAPLVVARGGFSGLFPDSSSKAYNLAMMVSVPDVVLWCDVQLTKDGAGICFPDIYLDNSSDIQLMYPNRANAYDVNGHKTKGFYPIDFTLKELAKVFLTQGIYSRNPGFDDSMPILTVVDVFTQNKPQGFWLNIQYDAFYNQHNLSMRSFLIGALKNVIISHISSPEINFLRSLVRPFASTKTKLVFRFLGQDVTEPSTNLTYGSLLKNLTFIKTFASGILVPKDYIWHVDAAPYLQDHTSLVADAHKIGLEVFAADFANDVSFAYNYSYNPISEYLNFIDNGDSSVDGVLSDFPVTASEARDCFAHLGKNASAEANTLVIAHNGASGDFPACTDLSYTNAISYGADVIDCSVQMSKDGVPFCLQSINLMNSTQVGQTHFRDLIEPVNEIQPSPGIFSFRMNWSDIKGLTPVMSNPFPEYMLYRNPLFKNAGTLISLSDFLELAKNASSLSGVMIKIENAKYLAVKRDLDVVDAVLKALDQAGYNGPTAKKVMILSRNSSVLVAMKGKKYELVYEVDETIRDALNATIQDITTFANSVVVHKASVFPSFGGFLQNMTNVVSHLHSFKLPVYVEVFRNEFVSQAYDFLCDPVVELNTYVMGAEIDGVITDFPQTAAAYKKNLCLKMKNKPRFMSPVQPDLLQLVSRQVLPPSEAPRPLLTVDNVTEAPLPPAESNAPPPGASAPTKSPNSQNRVAVSAVLSCLAMIVAALLF